MSCSDDMTARIWEMRRVKNASQPDQVTVSGEMRLLEGHRNWVTGISWSPTKIAKGHELVATWVFPYNSPPRAHLSLPIVHRSIAQRGCGMPIQANAYKRSRTTKNLYTRSHSVRMGDGLLLVVVMDGFTFMTSRYDIYYYFWLSLVFFL